MPKNTKHLWLPGLIVLAAAFLLYRRIQPPAVETVEVRTGDLMQVVFATGVVKPDREAAIAPSASGPIIELPLGEGDRVRAGQVIARLDSAVQSARLNEAERRLETAQARLAQVLAPADAFELAEAEARWRASQSREESAQRKRESAAKAHEIGKEDVAAAQLEVNLAEIRQREAEEAVRAAEAAVSSAQARLKAAQENVRVWSRGQMVSAEAASEAAGQEATAARARLDTQEDLLRRRKRLLEGGAIAEQDVIETQNAVREGRAQWEAAQAKQRSATATVEVARQTIAMAQAQVEDFVSQLASSQAQAAQSRRKAEEARLQVDHARSQLKRSRVQMENLALQEQESESGTRSVSSDSKAVWANMQQIRRGAREVEMAVLRKEVQTAQAAVTQARVDLAKCTVLAPFSGVITERLLEVGDFAGIGTPLARMANEQKFYVEAQVDEADLAAVRLHSPARFTIDAYPERVYTGSVSRIGDASDRANKTYTVEIRDLSSTEGLRIDISTEVNIEGPTMRNAVLVPTSALRTEARETIVWVVNKQYRLERRPVRLGNRNEGHAEIRSGVRPGERIAREAPDSLREGQTVSAVPPRAP